MEYSEVDIRLNQINPYTEILIAKLDEIKFESYLEHENGLKAYVPTHVLNEHSVIDIINDISNLIEISYTIKKIKNKNWNKIWESSYHPVFINDFCVIRSEFHKPISHVKYEIIIAPKMSFGTGHHETTSLVMNRMFDIDFKNKSVLDMGSGTGVLSILASKLGASDVVAIDYDEWSFKNGIENANLNGIEYIHFIHGDINAIPNKKFDVVLANINRNIILQDLQKYVESTNTCADIILSGFLKEDIILLNDKIQKLKLELVILKSKNKWQMIHLRKK